MPLRTAQRLLGVDGVSRVDILVGEGATTGRGRVGARGRAHGPAVRALVAGGPGRVAPLVDRRLPATTALIAAVALFVGAFLIFNTLSMTVTERIRELGLLRAAGVTRIQLTRFVLVQAAVLGVAGSFLGLLVGAGLAGRDGRLRPVGRLRSRSTPRSSAARRSSSRWRSGCS